MLSKIITLFSLLSIFSIKTDASRTVKDNLDYELYHQQVLEAEKLIVLENYQGALQVYGELFDNYEFVFLKEYRIATQLAWLLKDTIQTKQFLKEGILAGWTLKSIKKNDFLDGLKKGEDWKRIKEEYRSLRFQYESKFDEELKERVRKMFSKDQWKAIGALFTFGSKGQDRYAERKFAAHSEKQIGEFVEIYDSYGYPGEKLVGNNYWMSTILSHHNSISQEYARKDTLYPFLKPKLHEALKNGQLSPFEFALIDEWYRTVKGDKEAPRYGILNPPSASELSKTNKLRAAAYLSPIEVRNQLVDIEEKTGMNFYLQGGPWIEGKIEVGE